MPETLTFTCGDCGRGFDAPQGSRRYYCAECVTRRRQESGRIHGPLGAGPKAARKAERRASLERAKTRRRTKA